MLEFELPALSGPITIDSALEETIQADKSGLLYVTGPGELRLIHFDQMLQAKTSGRNLLEEVSFEPVIEIKAVPNAKRELFVRAANQKFGFRGFGRRGVARLFSTRESDAGPYIASSSGVRCKRPNKPASVLPRDWYHYYPPLDRNRLSPPDICEICGFPL